MHRRQLLKATGAALAAPLLRPFDAQAKTDQGGVMTAQELDQRPTTLSMALPAARPRDRWSAPPSSGAPTGG